MSEMWNLWYGCHKKSEGCQHCYVFRCDAEFEKDSSIDANVPFHFKQTGALCSVRMAVSSAFREISRWHRPAKPPSIFIQLLSWTSHD